MAVEDFPFFLKESGSWLRIYYVGRISDFYHAQPA
jgi:hypothetical protein